MSGECSSQEDPIEPIERTSATSLYNGIASAFTKAGVKEIARRPPTRPVMRFIIRE